MKHNDPEHSFNGYIVFFQRKKIKANLLEDGKILQYKLEAIAEWDENPQTTEI